MFRNFTGPGQALYIHVWQHSQSWTAPVMQPNMFDWSSEMCETPLLLVKFYFHLTVN